MLSNKIRQKQGFRKNKFYKTFNPNHVINLNKFTRSLENISNKIKQCFQNKTVQLATRQPKNLKKQNLKKPSTPCC